jgi:hypothetical protein
VPGQTDPEVPPPFAAPVGKPTCPHLMIDLPLGSPTGPSGDGQLHCLEAVLAERVA